uniref:Uncharacterized protein n=1 Tax=Ditylenchus dipsaci TaxID=166011 RepID=A0A915DEN0_9BILA
MSNFIELNNSAMVIFGSGPAAVKFGGSSSAVKFGDGAAAVKFEGNPSVANVCSDLPAVKFGSGYAMQSLKMPLDAKKTSGLTRKDGKMSKKKLRAMRSKEGLCDIDEYMRGLNFKSPAVNQSTNLSLCNIPNASEQLNVGWGSDGEDAPVKHVEEPLNPHWHNGDGNDPKKVEVNNSFISGANMSSKAYPAVKYEAPMNASRVLSSHVRWFLFLSSFATNICGRPKI